MPNGLIAFLITLSNSSLLPRKSALSLQTMTWSIFVRTEGELDTVSDPQEVNTRAPKQLITLPSGFNIDQTQL